MVLSRILMAWPGSGKLVPQEQGAVRVGAAAVAGDDVEAGVLDLALGLDLAALQLANALHDVEHALDVGLAEQAAVGVHGQFAAELDAAALHPGAALALGTHAVVLEGNQGGDRE